MLLASSSTWIALLLAAQGQGHEVPLGPRLEVLAGNVRVFAKEAWMTLAPGALLPESRSNCSLSLAWDARARLTLNGAGVELRGPLEVESNLQDEWTVRLTGSGQVQVDARRAAVNVELAATARLDMDNGMYWAEGLPDGGWRVGCDAGLALVLRPPIGTGWRSATHIVSGTSLRIVPLRTAPPITLGAVRKLSGNPWKSFSWPWACAAQ